jgi:hypothetical protein
MNFYIYLLNKHRDMSNLNENFIMFLLSEIEPYSSDYFIALPKC